MTAQTELPGDLAALLGAGDRQFRAIFENSTAGIAVVDLQGRYLLVNPAYTEILGYSLAEFSGLDFMRLTHPDDLALSRRVMGDVIAARGKQIRFAKRYIHKDGHAVWAEVSSALMYGPDGQPSHFITHMVDVTERELAERELEQEKEQLAVTLRSIGDGVITTDLDGAVVTMNEAAEALTGVRRGEAAGRRAGAVLRLVDDRTRSPRECPAEAVLRDNHAVDGGEHLLLVSRDGTERMVVCHGAPLRGEGGANSGVVLVVRDVTERNKLLDAAARTQRLESLGVMAGGIAHDFNNLLTGLFGTVQLALESPEDPAAVRENLEDALGVLGRARALPTRLLTLSKGGSPIRRSVDLGQLLREATRFALSGSEVVASLDLAPDLEPVHADPNQLAQVFDNLILNARQAMPRGGRLEVRARSVPAGAPLSHRMVEGPAVCVSLRDEGNGISREHLPRIFDPFFTTKQQGSGLGLASVYSILARHGGAVEVESELGKGSTFRVWLPVGSPAGLAAPPDAVTRPELRGRKVLVLDDQDYVRQVVAGMLRRLGCEARVVADGSELIASRGGALRDGWGPDVYLLDLTNAGGVGGRQVLEALRARNAEVRAVAVSGYADDPVLARPGEFGFAASLRKPFTLAELEETLARALAAGALTPHQGSPGAP